MNGISHLFAAKYEMMAKMIRTRLHIIELVKKVGVVSLSIDQFAAN
jgi:hypothetical protein